MNRDMVRSIFRNRSTRNKDEVTICSERYHRTFPGLLSHTAHLSNPGGRAITE